MNHYKPLEIIKWDTYGLKWALEAMRAPKENSTGDSDFDNDIAGPKDIALLSNLQRTGDDHGKANRGVDVWVKFRFQVGWMIEFVTYSIGVDDLSTSSSMHNELKHLLGVHLAEQKQLNLTDKVYTRYGKFTYQALRRIYLARRHHKHPCWQIFCDWIETLPYAAELITPPSKMQVKMDKLKTRVTELEFAVQTLMDECGYRGLLSSQEYEQFKALVA